MRKKYTKFYKVEEVAALLSLHWQTILTYIKNGELVALKLGKGYRISQEELDEFINKKSTRGKK